MRGGKRESAVDSRITNAYGRVFRELSDTERYATYSVGSFFCARSGIPEPDKVNVVVRVDVDDGLHLCVPLAKSFTDLGIESSFYFLTNESRYYRVFGSGIPKEVVELGHESGLHTDHYYEQLVSGIDGLAVLKEDVSKLSAEIGQPVRGMVCHGHPAIDALGKRNWELTKDLAPSDLGLEYHDGLMSCYIKPGSRHWAANCDINVSDYFGYPHSRGWNYYAGYPLNCLRRAKRGQVVHCSLHPRNAFRYWEGWTDRYGEELLRRESLFTFSRKALLIMFRYGLLRGKSPKRAIYGAGMRMLAALLAKGLGRLWPRPGYPEPDTSREAGRKAIFDLGIDYWRNELEQFKITATDATVVEVGSGNGQWLLAFARDSKRVIGIEPHRENREFSERKIAEYPELARKIEIYDGVGEALPMEDETADVVLCAGVLMFTNQTDTLREMRRVVKPGGRVCITANGLGYFIMYILNGIRFRSTSKVRYGLNGMFATFVKWILRKELYLPKAVSPSEMRRCLADCGMVLENCRIWLPKDSKYPLRHLGFATNYAFVVRRGVCSK